MRTLPALRTLTLLAPLLFAQAGWAARPSVSPGLGIRQRADRLLRGMRSAPKRGAVGPTVRTEVAALLTELETLKAGAKLDAVQEHRATAAIGRVLWHLWSHAPAELDAAQLDHAERLSADAKLRRFVPTHETAVEIETEITRPLLETLTTEDGTVGPILREGGEPAPAWLVRRAGRGDVATVKWSDLSPTEQLDLLRSQSVNRMFYKDRRVPGLRLRGEITKKRAGILEIGGKQTGAGGTYQVGHVLMTDLVEYRGRRDVKTVGGMEIHFRQPGPAGRNVRDAFAISQKLLKSKAWSGHEHIPANLPAAVLNGDAFERFRLVDYWRPVNIVAELYAVIEGYALEEKIGLFGFMSQRDLATLEDHLDALGGGSSPRLESASQLKLMAVGFRPGMVYGVPRTKFGFEVRTLFAPNESQREHSERFVDAIQRGLLTQSYGVSRVALQPWFEARAKNGRLDWSTVGPIHYNRPIHELLEAAPAHLKSSPAFAAASDALLHAASADPAVKLFLHDWSQDPLLHGNDAALRKIADAQRYAVERVAQGKSLDVITEQFVRGSGLYDLFAGSIGLGAP